MTNEWFKEYNELFSTEEIIISKEDFLENSKLLKECREQLTKDDFFNWENEILNG